MRTSLKLVTVSFALGLSMWACGGDDEGSNSGTAGSGGSMAGEGGTEPTTNAGSKATAGTSTTGGTETAGNAGSGGTAGVSMGGMAAGGAPMDVAGQAPIGGDTTTMGGAPIGGAPDTAGAPAAIGGAADAGGAGGAPAVTSCKQTGTAPVCSNLNAQLCTGVDGCSLSATPCGGSPKACTDILLQGECNSTAGCMSSQAGCVDDPDPNHPRTECSTHSNAPNCVSAGCTYQPCGGTAVACSSLDEAACATHASYCAWQ